LRRTSSWRKSLWSWLGLLVSFSLCLSVRAQNANPISEAEISLWVNQSRDCPAGSQPYFWRLDYFDFKGDGNQEAIVVASSCATGTAGPDIHSVLSGDTSGKIVELKIQEVDPSTYDNLFGNRNYDLSVEQGLLVATYGDDPKRELPLVIRYKWNGKEFEVVSIKKTGVFRTSYDCTKAQGEVENAICHVKELAELDLQLNSTYKALLAKLAAPERQGLKSEQRAWILKRDKDCAPYKGWVDCLTDNYEKRMNQLKKRSASLPAATLSPKAGAGK
jgi:uncharacterized protein YecT (DUF1311 family)